MTHLFACGHEQFKSIQDGSLSFDIDNGNISVGDRVIYQEVGEDDVMTRLEEEVVVSFVYSPEGLKKGFTAFQFKEKEQQ